MGAECAWISTAGGVTLAHVAPFAKLVRDHLPPTVKWSGQP